MIYVKENQGELKSHFPMGRELLQISKSYVYISFNYVFNIIKVECLSRWVKHKQRD